MLRDGAAVAAVRISPRLGTIADAGAVVRNVRRIIICGQRRIQTPDGFPGRLVIERRVRIGSAHRIIRSDAVDADVSGSRRIDALGSQELFIVSGVKKRSVFFGMLASVGIAYGPIAVPVSAVFPSRIFKACRKDRCFRRGGFRSGRSKIPVVDCIAPVGERSRSCCIRIA